MPFVATTNIPGYLPMDDDPPVFETTTSAWAHLAEARRESEDHAALVGDESDAPYSSTVEELDANAQAGGEVTGTVYGDTPGSEGEHDLGLAYSVTLAETEG